MPPDPAATTPPPDPAAAATPAPDSAQSPPPAPAQAAPSAARAAPASLEAQDAPTNEPQLVQPQTPSSAATSKDHPLGVAGPAPASSSPTLSVAPVLPAQRISVTKPDPNRIQNADGTVTQLHPTVTGRSLDRPVAGSGRTSPPEHPTQAKAAGTCVNIAVHVQVGGSLRACHGPAGNTAALGAGAGYGATATLEYDPNPPSKNPRVEAQLGGGVGPVGAGVSGKASRHEVSGGGEVGLGPATARGELSSAQGASLSGEYDLLYEGQARRSPRTAFGWETHADLVLPLEAPKRPSTPRAFKSFKAYLNDVQKAIGDRFGPRSLR